MVITKILKRMDRIPIFDLHEICRICLKNDLLVSIFSIAFLIRPIDIIEKLNIFKYNPDDGLPTMLCQSCIYRLLDAYNLQQLSESSEIRLRDYMVKASGSSKFSAAGGTVFNKMLVSNNANVCFSLTSVSNSQDVKNTDSVGIYDNIYDIFDAKVTNDVEVEDDVLNDVLIDVSSLTRSEADEDTLSDIPVEDSLGKEGLDDIASHKVQAKKNALSESRHKAVANIDKRLKKNSEKVLTLPEKCLECSKTFNYSGYLEVHMRTHTGEKPFPCKLCSRSFTQSGNLILHMRTHTGERRFQCEMCAGFFTTSSNLKAHKLTHLERREFACQKCSQLFKTQRDLRKHEPVHKTTKDIICTLCQKAFTRSSYLSAHMTAVHRGTKHTCPECNRIFGSRSNLVCHMRTHNGEKPFHCKHCTWKFNQSSALVRHMRKHGEQSNPITEISNKALISDYIRDSKLDALSGELITQETMQLQQQNEFDNMNSLSQLNTQLMEESGTNFTLSGTSSLDVYSFTKDGMVGFSTNQQQQQNTNTK